MQILLQYAAVRDDDDQLQPGEEEPSVIKGLLPCIFGILGVAFSIWLVVYFYLPPQSKWM